MQNLLYALIQIAHNFGAVAIVGVSAYGAFYASGRFKRLLAATQVCAWLIQGLSGGLFGLTTFYYYHHLPDIYGVAVAALVIKVTCVIFGFSLGILYLFKCYKISPFLDVIFWRLTFSLGLIALSSAAFLRWFS